MGRQVSASLDDLALAGCLVQIAFFVEDNEGTPVVVRRPIVMFWDGCEIGSRLGDCLNFYCSSRDSHNFWVLERIIDLGVPFTWS